MNYRAYFWGNFYLSSIQQGIQAAHVVAEMTQDCFENDDFNQWIHDDKTIILKNGGDMNALFDIKYLFETYAGDEGYSWSYFQESKSALNETLTSVGIIVPVTVYNSTTEGAFYLSGFEGLLYDLIKSTKMAI